MKFSKPRVSSVPASRSLVVRSRAELTVFRFTPQAVKLREKALRVAEAIDKVESAEDQRRAVAAQLALADVIKAAKATWDEAKRPIIDYRKKMDECAKQFLAELEGESNRLALAIGDFQAVQLAKQRAAQQAENDRLAELERQRAEELAKANTVEEMDHIQEKYCDMAAAQAAQPVVQPPRVAGQQVREDWEVEVTDIWLLARAHPGCVKIEPRLGEIKSLLDAGVQVAGVRAKRQVKSGVRPGQVTVTV